MKDVVSDGQLDFLTEIEETSQLHRKKSLKMVYKVVWGLKNAAFFSADPDSP
jgi:hypothetical protein